MKKTIFLALVLTLIGTVFSTVPKIKASNNQTYENWELRDNYYYYTGYYSKAGEDYIVLESPNGNPLYYSYLYYDEYNQGEYHKVDDFNELKAGLAPDYTKVIIEDQSSSSEQVISLNKDADLGYSEYYKFIKMYDETHSLVFRTEKTSTNDNQPIDDNPPADDNPTGDGEQPTNLEPGLSKNVFEEFFKKNGVLIFVFVGVAILLAAFIKNKKPKTRRGKK